MTEESFSIETHKHTGDDDSQNKKAASKKKRKNDLLRKNPNAPRRFKSSYILFFMSKQNEIKSSLPKGSSVGDVSKESSKLWKNLPAHERAYWDNLAEEDKARFHRERDSYTGAWHIPYKRAKKNPRAPKRPMSSFLYFSRERRDGIKAQFPDMKNTKISSRLGEMWRNLNEEQRLPYIEMELEQRKLYKIAMEEFNREEEAHKLSIKVDTALYSPLAPPVPQQHQQQSNYSPRPYYPPCESRDPQHSNTTVQYSDHTANSRLYLGQSSFGCTSPVPVNINYQCAPFTLEQHPQPQPIFTAQKRKLESIDDTSFFTFAKDIFG